MKTFLLTSLLGCSSLFAMAQTTTEKQFDREHTVDLLVVYDETNGWEITEDYQNARETFAQEVVNSLNLVMKNSNIDYTYRVASTHYWAGYKAQDINGGLNDITWNQDVKNKRRETKADIVLLLTENYDTNSGAANPSAIHTEAYACVRRSMAASAYTAAHEIGHILGANHSDSPNEQQPSNHPWANGYVSPEGLMTVLCSMGSSVPIYSGPNSIWKTQEGKEIVMGDATHDNVRMIKSMLPQAVHFGDYTDPTAVYASKQDLLFDNRQQQGELVVYSNGFTNISVSGDWIKALNPTFCNDQAKVTFSVDANYTGKERIGGIVLNQDGVVRTIPVTQSAAVLNLDLDKGTYNQNCDSFIDNGFVQVSRTFNNTEWQSLYIPFLWRFEDWNGQFEVAELKNVTQTPNGEAELTIKTVTEGNLQPHTPYLIKANKTGKFNWNLNHVNLYAATSKSVEYTAGNQKFTFTGTYDGLAGQDMFNNGYYGMSNGTLAPTNNVNAKLGAFRWYLNITDNAGNPLENPVKIKVVVQGSDATGIDSTEATLQNFDVYDINGRLIKKSATNTDDLQHGIYVINGKKVVL